MYFEKRLLKYETASNNNNNLDYGEVSQIITDKLINVDMGGSSYTLESVAVENGYIPKLGDWVVIEWQNGNPIAKGSNGTIGGNGLIDINSPTIISQNDLASGTINGDHIRYNSIDADHIQAGAITVDHISANTITANMIQANAVQTIHISANAVTGDKIDAGTITSDNIKAGAINSTAISANSIGTVHLEANSVTSQQISANSIQTQHISANTIVSNQIKADQINSTHISANSITSDEIVANAVQTQHISANSITAQQISANSVQTQHISANTITTNMIQANAINSNLISANQVNASHISANSITATAISANAVQTQHISANTISTNQIKAGAITTALISANTITSNLIQANAIQTQHISANSITGVQISAGAISTQHISANAIDSTLIKANAVQASAITANAINSYHITANAIQTQHISANSITSNLIQAGAVQATQISANSVQTQHISANTITTLQIQAGAITSALISANSITSQLISANSITSQAIQSNAVLAQHISANQIETQHISANSIIGNQIQANAINSTHISANAVQAQQISANSVQAQHVSANSIQTQHISANTITTNQIKAGAITSNLITANAITSQLITANAITSFHISASAVTSSQISANAVQAQHISANSIQTQHISANTITSVMIQAGAINSTLITANAITSNLISSNSILGYHISANQISGNHIVAGTIQTGHISANSINANLIQANAINSTHISANAVTAVAINSNSIQSRHISANAIQANMISANQVNATHISANSVLSNMISANQVQAQHISANSVQTQHISANTIEGYQIQANQISGNHIVAGSISTDHLAVGTVQQGLLGQYYTYSAGATNKFQNFKGSQVDTTINFSWGSGSPSIVGQSDNFAVRWQGFIQAPETGSYTFITVNDDTMRVVVNNTQVINTGYASGNEVSGSAITLTANNWYPILVEMTEGTGSATAILKWVRPSLTKEVIPQKYFTQGNTQIDGAQILTGTITASNIQVGTITADSGIIATAAIKTANIASGNITSALIGLGEIKTANIASGNITNALIADATINHAKILSVDAGTITVGQLDGSIIKAGTISGNQILAQSITADRLKTGTIDTVYIKAGAIVTDTISSGAVTTDKIEAGAITGDLIRAGSITAEHISTVGLDAQLVQVYNSTTGETLIGSGYLRVDGLDVGVVQSDNLIMNGLFLASSSDYGFKRMNPSGEALLGNTITGIGSHQVWKIDLTSGNVVKTIDIPSKKPFDIAIHPTGNYAYITVQGDNTLLQLDIVQDTLTQHKLNMGMGPARTKFVGDILDDDKHVFVLNTDPDDMHIPDSLTVIDTPPSSVNGDLYVHHNIVLGNNPYDFIVDGSLMTYVTMASTGDIVMIDTSGHDSHFWKVKGRIAISAYGTDNNHADLPSQFGLQEVTGGDASGQYNDNSSSSSMSGMGGMDAPNGYGTSDGSLRTYTPHGIVQSSDPNTLYVVDYANGELVVIDKHGNAPYNALIGTTAQGSYQMSNVTSSSSPASLGSSEAMGGGPGTYYVRYRIPVGDSPDFIELINGKLFISLGSGDIAVVDEQQIINEINADNSYYGNYLGEKAEGSYEHWNVFQPMRTVNPFTVRTISNVGIDPSIMKVLGNNLYVSLGGQSQVAVIDTVGETITKYINVGTNPKGFDFTPDGKYMYVANYGGIGNLSFIYPQGSYIGDPFMALEGGIMYQGANGWTPDRSDWVYDASGNIQSKSTVEFHINEPLKNEGGYAKLTSYGIDPQYAQIEQDILNVENYSNGNNVVVVTGGRLIGNYDSSVWTPREGAFISGTVHNIMIGSIVSGNSVLTSANASQYSVSYSLNQISFSANAVASGNWVQADYTAPNNIYFKTHNSSVEIAVDNGSSPNFATSFQVDEFVPNFVAVDNRQTSSFTPTADGISDTYEGLEYSLITNRALNIPSGNITSNMALSGGSAVSTLVDGITNISGNYVGNATGNQYVQLDLGSVYMVGMINVWHYSNDNRTYHNTKTQVSEDGTNWTTVFDSSISGEYAETTSGHMIMFDAKPTRYVRDWINGSTSNPNNHWVEIQAFGDWQVEKGYTYPSNSTKSGQQIATNGIGFVSTDVSKAYVAMNVQINFTSWWWMTYVVGPDFGRIKIEMPTLMNSGHFLNQQAPFVNNVAHRHIMSFPPSAMIQSDSNNNIESGKHRIIIRQDSGKVTLDRLRFDDFQMYQRSTLSIPSQSSPATFTRYKVIAEQAKWYQGKGKQSTEGAYDTPRTNPDTGQPDYSVPIKYRVRVLSQLSPTGQVQERGTIYVTSAIFETGKQSTHWRRSEASDVFAGNKIETWNPSQPMNTGIQSAHLADGAVRSSKILPNAVYDYHISNYARIQEHKLELNYPTHQHGWYTVSAGAGPMGTDLYIWNDNLSILNTIQGWAGTSGNYGTGNVIARGDHNHDSRYLTLSGGQITNTLNTKAIYSNGNITVTGNIIVTGTVDGVDVSVLSSNVSTVSGNLNSHIGAGGSVHAVVTASANGFMINTDKNKLDGISANAINTLTADTLYTRLSGNNLNNTTIGKLIEHERNVLLLGNNDWTPLIYSTTGGKAYYNASYKGVVLSGNSTWIKVRTRLPIDPESTYFLRAKVTKNMGSGSVYIGADTLDNNYNSLATDQAQSYNYFGASAITITSGNSQYFESTISGYNSTSGSNSHMFDPSGNYFDLVLIANYGDTSGIGQTTFEWVELYKAPNTFYVGSNGVLHSGNFNTTTLNGHVGSGGNAHALVTSSNAGFMSASDKSRLDAIQDSAINQTTTDGRYLQLTGGALSGGLSVTGNIAITGTVDGVDVSNLNSSVGTISGNLNTTNSNIATISGNLNTTNSNLATLSGNIITVSGNLNTTNTNLSNLSANVTTISGNLNTTNSNLATLSGNIITVSGNLNTTNTNVANLSGNIVTVSGNLNTTNGNISTLSGNIVTLSGNLNTTNANVSTLSGNIATVSGNLNTTNSNVSTLSGNIATLSGNLNTTNTNLASLSGNTATISGNLNTTNSNIATLSGNIVTLSGNLNTANSNIATLSGNIVTVSGNLNTTNSNVSVISGNLYGHIGSGGNAHPVATSGSAGFMGTADRTKLDGIQTGAINQSTADGRYLQLIGGALSGGLSVTGNISVTGTVDGVDVSNLNNSYTTTSANVTNHIGSGGSAHAVAISGGANGFIDGTNYGKLLRIQDNAINQSTADGRYLQLTGGAINGGISVTGNISVTGTVDGVDVSVLSSNVSTLSGNIATTSGNLASHIGAGGSVHAVVNASSNGFMSYGDKNKLDGISANAINQTFADTRYLTLTGGTLTGSLVAQSGISVTGNISITGTVDGVDVSNLNNSYATTSANVTNHIGSGGSAHAVAVSGGSNGFIDGANYGKLLRIQDNSINQATADSRYLQLTGGALSGGLSVTGNISVTGTVDGVDVSVLNSSYATTSANVTNHIGSGNTAHPVAISGGVAGFIDGTSYAKLLNIQSNAINQTTSDGRYLQLTGGTLSSDLTLNGQLVINQYNAGIQFKSSAFDSNGYQWWHGPSGSGDNVLLITKVGTSNYTLKVNGTDTVWTTANLGTDPATRTWVSGNYYNSQSIDTKLQAKGDVFLANANTFTNTNTFTTAGLGIKIQPSGSVANTTKLLQINNTGGSELFSVNYSGGVVVAGDLTVTGQTRYAGTTTVNGDYNISGNLYVSGNSTLGNTSTDTTTVNGTMVVNGSIQEVGSYEQVHRRPLFGIAGDLQFQTSSTTFDNIVDFYDLSAYALPTTQTSATRYYQLYVVYGDDINSTQASGGQQSTLRISGNTTKDLILPYTWGNANGRRDWYSAYFTDLPTGNGNLQAMLAQSGNNLGIRWVELIAYDKF